MFGLSLLLILIGAGVALPLTLLARSAGRRLGTLDGAGVSAQVKAEARAVPNTGGIAIHATIFLLIGLGLAIARVPIDLSWLWPAFESHLPGIRQQTAPALVLLASLLALHIMGVIDDRHPLPAWPKMLVMLGAAFAVSLGTGSRLLEALDPHVGGAWLSIGITVLWMIVVCNAFNFLDNMDGLSGGVALVCACCLLAATLVNQQFFVAAGASILIGALLGFLAFNYPIAGRASIFMGDGGSLVVGFMLAFLTVRITYVDPALGGAWHAVFMPLIILAIPLYDFVSVVCIRMRQGRSPFVGDLQHFSHRLVRRGLTPRAAVTVICGCAVVTGIGGISLGRLHGWQAALVVVQTVIVIAVIATFEWAGRHTSTE